MEADAYVGSIKRVIPIYHVSKNRKLKGDVDSYLANANMQQEMLNKAKKKKPVQAGDNLGTYAYTTQATEVFLAEAHQFDQKA